MDFLPVPPHARQEVVLWPWHLGHNVFGILLVSQGAVAELVGIEGGVVSGVINLESSGVEASDWRLRHDQAYHEA